MKHAKEPPLHSGKHRRSRKGCYTCRRRKKRCDETKPVCSACKRLNLSCSYPAETDSHAISKDAIQKSFHPDQSIHLENGLQSWTEHPQMTHSEVCKPSVFNESSLKNGTPASQIDQHDLQMSPGLHFPLHFSRVDNKPSHAPYSGSNVPKDVSHGINAPTPFDLQMIGGGGRDFLTPLLQAQPSITDISPELSRPDAARMFNQSHTATPPIFPYSDNMGYNPPLNLMVGDELPEPFAAAIPVPLSAPPIPITSLTSSSESASTISAHASASSKSDSLPADDTDQGSISAGPTTEKFRLTYPDLDENAVNLFNYFRDKQSTVMSVSPLNYFRSVFLAFSLKYRAIMYGVLAWAAWHHGGQEEQARKYFEKGSALIRQESLNSRSKEEILAALLVLASAKICSGDTSDWRPYLVLAGETIHLHGGLTSFMESESVRWLLKNFAYHEILASSSLNLPKLFSANDFEIIFNQPSSATLPDTLCACCQPVFVVLERINELTRTVRLLLMNHGKGFNRENSKSPLRNSADKEPAEEEIYKIYTTANELERKIWTLQPAHKILQHLSERDLRLQLTLFDVFKLVAILHMYQSVLRINSGSLSMRVVARRLHKCINELFGTMVEGILIFPLFILGISTTTTASRKYVVERFRGMEERLNARNVSQALLLVQKVWECDNFGQQFVDWNELVDNEGLHFCFA